MAVFTVDRLLAAIHVVGFELAVGLEVGQKGFHDGFALRGHVFFDLQIVLDDQPAGVVGAGLFDEFGR